MRRINVTLVGSIAGKTPLIHRYVHGEFLDLWVPTILDDWACDVMVNSMNVKVTINDTNGSADFQFLRRTIYPATDIFLMCFAIDNPDTYESVEEVFVPEIEGFMDEAIVILVGCTKYRRDDPKTISDLRERFQTPVTREMGVAMAQRIGAKSYLECSALTGEGVREVFQEAVQILLRKSQRPSFGTSFLKRLFGIYPRLSKLETPKAAAETQLSLPSLQLPPAGGSRDLNVLPLVLQLEPKATGEPPQTEEIAELSSSLLVKGVTGTPLDDRRMLDMGGVGPFQGPERGRLGEPRASPEDPDKGPDMKPVSETNPFKWTGFILSPRYGSGKGYYRQRSILPDARGEFSEVWKCEIRINDQISGQVAVMRLRATMATMTNSQEAAVMAKLLKRLQHELIIWMALDSNPNIAPLVGFALPNELSVVSPWCSNGNLRVYLQDHPGSDRLKLILDVAKGLKYLHGRIPRIVHGDVKPDNVLISDDGSAILTDFGLSKVVEDESTFGSADITSLREAGNIRWMAPELWKTGCTRSCESDVYSFGSVMLEIFTGQPPFNGIKDIQLHFFIFNGGKPASDRGTYPQFGDEHSALWRIMCSCWEVKPEERPIMASITTEIAELQEYVEASQ